MRRNINKKVKGEKLVREIHLNNIEEEEKDEDWDFVKNPIILKKKTVSPRKRETILNFFPDLIRNKKKIALVLSGGGAKGLAHVGLIEELEKYNIDIRFISGTSMGAIIGALYALEGNLKLINKYIKYRTRDLVTLRDFSFTLKGIIKGRAIEELLKDLYGNSTFEDTKIPLVINAVDIETGKEVVFRKGKIIDAVRASMSIPIVFEPKRIKGKMYVDGGVVNNVPYSHVPKMYKRVVVCDVNSKIPPLKGNVSGVRYFLHMIALMEHNATKVPNDKRIIWVRPEMGNIYVGDFNKMSEAIKKGTKEAVKVLPKYFKKIK